LQTFLGPEVARAAEEERVSVFGIGTPSARHARVLVVYANDRDRERATTRGRLVGRLDAEQVRPAPYLIGAAAGVGLVLGVGCALLATSLLARTLAVSWALTLFASGLSGLVGAVLGMALLARAARTFVREVNGHLSRGRVVDLIACGEADADGVARDLEQQGALEATILPVGLVIERFEPPIPFDLERRRARATGDGATLIAGGPLLAASVRRLEHDGLTLCVLGRDGHSGPVHSSTGGPAWIHEIPPSAGDGWWRALDRFGKPLHVRFADGELVLVGDATRTLVPILSGHVNDSIGSALARIAEEFGCPTPSARIVCDQIDGGGTGVVIVGDVDARRRAVEELSRAVMATSEGTLAVRSSHRVKRVA
jgi:hypothetical protein